MPELDERQFSYPISMDVSMCPPNGCLYPAAYQRMITEMVQAHLMNIHMDIPRLVAEYNVSWVLLSMSIELRHALSITDQLHIRTWHTSHHLPIYRREFAIYDADETMVAVGTTFSSLLDLTTRRICMDLRILNQFILPDGEVLLNAASRFQEEPVFLEAETRKVRPSWLDGLGHVNNCRYGDFVFDALSARERADMSRLTRLDVWFLSELKPDMSFVMEKAVEGSSIYVRGAILPDQKVSFVMKLTMA